MAQNPYEFDYNLIPFGGISGGEAPTMQMPKPLEVPAMPQMPPNPFGGDQAAATQSALGNFRAQAGKQGLRVDAGDAEAYKQMQAGFGSLSPVEAPAAAVGNPLASPVGGFQNKLEGYLDKVLSSGGFTNPDVAKQRKESIKDSLDVARQGILKQNQASLADRGMLSLPGAPSGVEASSIGNLDSRLGASYAGSLRDIYTDENEAAAARFMDALGLGVTREDNLLKNTLAQAEADRLNRALGLETQRFGLERDRFGADSAFRQAEQQLASQLGLGRLQLDTDVARSNSAAQSTEALQQLIDQILNATQTGAGGYY